MLIDFRDVIKSAKYAGSDAPAIAMGLNFLENMIASSAGQINALKQAERQTREALKAAVKAKSNGSDPEKPTEQSPEPPPPPAPPSPTPEDPRG